MGIITSRRTSAYYRVWFDDSDPLAAFSREEDLRGVDRWIVDKGTRIEAWPDGVTLFIEGEHLEDYLFSVLPDWIVVSERARRALEQCQINGIQFLPVRVVRKASGVEVGPYWLLHVVRQVEGLDWERTRWFHPENKYKDEHPLLDIITVVLNAEAIEGIDIFRLKVKDSVRGVYISHKVKQCLESAGAVSGFRFEPVRVS